MSEETKVPLLRVEHLKKYYPVRGGLITHTIGQVHAVDDVSFTISAGETLGLVGESGCGKSTIGRQIAGLEKPTAGKVFYDGKEISAMTPAQLAPIRTQIQMVFQDSYSALNPRKRVFDILAEPMCYHHLADRRSADAKVDHLLEMVGLPKNAKERYPHEFSGGQRQRIGIARALSLSPRLLILDEPVSALDVSVQAQVLNLLRDLQKELGLAYLFIGHGLAAVDYISDRVAVMYLGKLEEIAPSSVLFRSPVHPYTRALLAAAPKPNPDTRAAYKAPLQGEVGSAIDPPAGCRFASRCPYAVESCRKAAPALVSVGPGHFAACPVVTKEGV
ncbi:MAG: ABC transporter ATP-binding protein [Faecalibacterium sp.]|jgi:oligopeptide transport system ATP-binding protein|nr:ABC transporter ATP-binding protein [Faecalibacterium sp.]